MLAPLAVLCVGLLLLATGLAPRLMGDRVEDEALLVRLGGLLGVAGVIWLVVMAAGGLH